MFEAQNFLCKCKEMNIITRNLFILFGILSMSVKRNVSKEYNTSPIVKLMYLFCTGAKKEPIHYLWELYPKCFGDINLTSHIFRVKNATLYKS